MYLIAYQILGDRGGAEDVVQEAFLALWRNCNQYRARYAVDTWLRRITTNKAIDAHRRLSRAPRPLGEMAVPTDAPGIEATSSLGQLVEPGAAGDPERRARQREVQELWDRISSGLPVQQRAAFVLREIEGLSTGEAAKVLGCSTSAVRSHISLARKALRRALQETDHRVRIPAHYL